MRMAHKNGAPTGRSHRPVLTVKYEPVDAEAGYGDALFMDLGQSTWSKEDFSAKIWRWAKNGQRWSRQGEELPLSRVLDLAILVAAAVRGRESCLHEFIQNQEQEEALDSFLSENELVFRSRLDELRKILQPVVPSLEMKEAPNLFNFATSELSQDAMFAWMLSWASPQCKKYDESLHAVALRFVKLLTGDSSLRVDSITVGRQKSHIDILAEINDDIVLAIEDKTGTTIHDNQLVRYIKAVENEYPNRKKCFAYVKTGNEPKSILNTVKKAGYKILLCNDIIKCLDAYVGENALVCNFRAHLKAQEAATQSFKSLPILQWTWMSWEGFYKELESKIELDNWSYVPNKSGGFLGAWWHFTPFCNTQGRGEMYLQFEQGDLCFKICPHEGDHSEVREECHNRLIKCSSGRFPEIKRPARFGAGQYMTIAKISSAGLFGHAEVDFDGVYKKLKMYELLIDECCGDSAIDVK